MSKQASEDEVLDELRDGMRIGIGGWGSRRKPMSLVRAIARSGLENLTIYAYGGPDVGLLCACGNASTIHASFVSLDSIPLEPHFRAARESGRVAMVDWDEGMFLLGLQAAAWRVPFLPTRVGLGSDLFRVRDDLRTLRSPYEDGEELVAAPAIDLDVAICHVNEADERGNAALLGADPYFDELFLGAAARRFISTERIVSTESLAGALAQRRISRLLVDGVVEAPHGAHFTQCLPDYGRDEEFQRSYAATAKSEGAWAEFKSRYVDAPNHAAYLAAVGLV